ncbi:MAG: hypothetical protein HRT44_03830 [Bdellovibrionales bacterium]|nr:hypothetical protein [Bdellovibrionales bacterium]NQZ18373.1 hypothetical protein [Bdellovibrionales bacterium]
MSPDQHQFSTVTLIQDQQLVGSNKLLDKVRSKCKTIAEGTDKYALNYQFHKLELKRHKAFDLLLNQEGEIAGWCGLFNGGRYPDGVFRIMNRLYLDPKYRKPFFAPYTRQLYFQQKERCADSIKLLFLSRNELKGKYHVKRWAKYNSGEEGWKVSDQLVKVAKGEDQMSYQYIAYKEYKPVEWNLRSVTEEEWLKLPKDLSDG